MRSLLAGLLLLPGLAHAVSETNFADDYERAVLPFYDTAQLRAMSGVNGSALFTAIFP